MPKGTIKVLRGGSYGYIKLEEGEDLFFHRSNLEGVEYNSLSEGREVEFEKSEVRDGLPAALKVKLAVTQADEKEQLERNEADRIEEGWIKP